MPAEVESAYKSYKAKGYNFFVGVPCSGLKDFIAEHISDPETVYIPAPREDIALGIAVGAFFAGKKPLVYLQSSGIGNLVNPITSLLKPYGLSVRLLISLRSKPFEHEFMHAKARQLMSLLEYEEYDVIEKNEAD